MNKIMYRAMLVALLAGGSVVAFTAFAPGVQAAEDAEADDAIDTGEFSRAFREVYSDAVEAFQDDMCGKLREGGRPLFGVA